MSIYNLLESNNSVSISSDVSFTNGITLNLSDPDLDSTAKTLSIYQTDTTSTLDILDDLNSTIGSCKVKFVRLGDIVIVYITDLVLETLGETTARFTLASDSIPDGYRVTSDVSCGATMFNGGDTHMSSTEITSSDTIRFTSFDANFPSGTAFTFGSGQTKATFTYLID